jgi:hypothetical protein
MTFFIPIVGTHCAGKSTLAKKLTELANDRGLNATFVAEVARDCPLPMHDGQTEETTKWILEEQIKREDALKDNFDIVFCDRSFADPLLYFFAKKENRPTLSQFLIENKKLCGKNFYQMSVNYNKRYKHTVFQLLSGKELESVTHDGFRDTDLYYRKNIQDIAIRLFNWITDHQLVHESPLSRSIDDNKHYNAILDIILFNCDSKYRKDSNPSEC